MENEINPLECGAPGTTRTCDLLVRSSTLPITSTTYSATNAIETTELSGCQRVLGGVLGGVASSLTIIPITLAEANAFVREYHRHHAPVPGSKFCLGVTCNDRIVGVAIVGRPVARMSDNGWTLEVNRTCTDGTRNANSILYGACRRATFALGYKKLITYTLPSESGASLRAAGWVCLGEAGGGAWSRTSRPRVDIHPTQTKLRWEAQP